MAKKQKSAEGNLLQLALLLALWYKFYVGAGGTFTAQWSIGTAFTSLIAAYFTALFAWLLLAGTILTIFAGIVGIITSLGAGIGALVRKFQTPHRDLDAQLQSLKDEVAQTHADAERKAAAEKELRAFLGEAEEQPEEETTPSVPTPSIIDQKEQETEQRLASEERKRRSLEPDTLPEGYEKRLIESQQKAQALYVLAEAKAKLDEERAAQNVRVARGERIYNTRGAAIHAASQNSRNVQTVSLYQRDSNCEPDE